VTTPHDDTVTLPDGRALAYLQRGDPAGRPVLYFHGIPGSRLDVWGPDDLAARVGARLVAPDRPGIGRSDPRPARRLLDWPADVAHLADALGLDRFAVLGYSAGGPYALACAHALPERVTAVGLLAAMGPLDGPKGVLDMGKPVYWRLARRSPRLMSRLWQLMGDTARKRPRRAVAGMRMGLSAPEKEVFGRPGVAERVVALLAETTRQGGTRVTEDQRVLLEPWGFRPEDVRVPVSVWHGDQDTFVRQRVGEAYARTIPGCRYTACPGTGHFFLEDRMEEILGALA